jgi:predicted component of type VI protein secretion system
MKKLVVLIAVLTMLMAGCSKEYKPLPYQELSIKVPDAGIRIVPIKVEYINDINIKIDAALVNVGLTPITNLHGAKLKVYDSDKKVVVDTLFADSKEMKEAKLAPGDAYTLSFQIVATTKGKGVLEGFGYEGTALYDVAGEKLKTGIYSKINNQNVKLKIDQSGNLLISLKDLTKVLAAEFVVNGKERIYTMKRSDGDIKIESSNITMIASEPYTSVSTISQSIPNSTVSFGQADKTMIISIYIK